MADPSDVKANGSEATDPKTGRKYFYNKITKKTSWKPPACWNEEPDNATGDSDKGSEKEKDKEESTTASASTGGAGGGGEKSADDVPANWKETADPKS